MTVVTNEHATEHCASQQGQARRRRLSQSFSRAAQSMQEATDSALRMVASLERQGLLLRPPSNQ